MGNGEEEREGGREGWGRCSVLGGSRPSKCKVWSSGAGGDDAAALLGCCAAYSPRARLPESLLSPRRGLGRTDCHVLCDSLLSVALVEDALSCSSIYCCWCFLSIADFAIETQRCDVAALHSVQLGRAPLERLASRGPFAVCSAVRTCNITGSLRLTLTSSGSSIQRAPYVASATEQSMVKGLRGQTWQHGTSFSGLC